MITTEGLALGAVLTWTCETCGTRARRVVLLAQRPMPAPTIPVAGWELIHDAERGALAYCAGCFPRVCRRLEQAG